MNESPLTLAQFAQVSALLDLGLSAEVVLPQVALDMEGWAFEQRRWLEEIGREMAAQRFDLQQEYTQLFYQFRHLAEEQLNAIQTSPVSTREEVARNSVEGAEENRSGSPASSADPNAWQSITEPLLPVPNLSQVDTSQHAEPPASGRVAPVSSARRFTTVPLSQATRNAEVVAPPPEATPPLPSVQVPSPGPVDAVSASISGGGSGGTVQRVDLGSSLASGRNTPVVPSFAAEVRSELATSGVVSSSAPWLSEAAPPPSRSAHALPDSLPESTGAPNTSPLPSAQPVGQAPAGFPDYAPPADYESAPLVPAGYPYAPNPPEVAPVYSAEVTAPELGPIGEPTLSIEHVAYLSALIQRESSHSLDALSRYGFSGATFLAETEAWSERLANDSSAFQRYEALVEFYCNLRR